jgi:hypothetical protein
LSGETEDMDEPTVKIYGVEALPRGKSRALSLQQSSQFKGVMFVF